MKRLVQKFITYEVYELADLVSVVSFCLFENFGSWSSMLRTAYFYAGLIKFMAKCLSVHK